MKRFALCAGLFFCGGGEALAQYAGNASGVAVVALPGSDSLRLDPQFGLGLTGSRGVGIGDWAWTYRALVTVTTAIDDPFLTTFIPAYMSSGLRYNFLNDRHRPFINAVFTYYQLTNAPADWASGTYLVGATARVGYEHYLATELSLQFDAGASWFIQLDRADPKAFDLTLALKVHY